MIKTWQVAVVALALAALPLASAPACAQRAAKPAQAERLSGPAMADTIVEGVMDRMETAIDAHWHKGEYNHAINLYKVEIAAEPTYGGAYANAGWLLWSMGRDPEAIALYEQGIKANPRSFYLYDEVGMYYGTHKRDWAKALPYYQKAAEQKDCPALTLHMLAHAYERTGQLDKAEQAWQRAIAMRDNPNRAAAEVNLARVRRLIQNKAPR